MIRDKHRIEYISRSVIIALLLITALLLAAAVAHIINKCRSMGVTELASMDIAAIIDPIETVIIGDKIWTKRNLNVVVDSSWCYKAVDGSLCYDNDTANCNKYGRLYTWNAAVEVCAGLGEGWRLPDYDDWCALVNIAGGTEIAGTKLKSKDGWFFREGDTVGTDDFGFSALPGGYYTPRTDSFLACGGMGIWWGNAPRKHCGNSNSAMSFTLEFFTGHVSMNYGNKSLLGLSVRCVRDN